MKISDTSQCEDCIHCELNGTKARLYIHCDFYEKNYFFGQYKECDNKVCKSISEEE